MIRRIYRLLVTCTALAYAPFAHPQPAGAIGEDFVYHVRPADTLMGLAAKYTGNSGHWTTLQHINNVDDPHKLPIGLPLRIPFSLIPVIPAPLTVIHASGQTKLDGTPLRVGMVLPEGSTIVTGPDGFVTLNFSDGSRLSVPNNSTARVDRTQQFKNTGLLDSVVSVEEGEVDAEVAPSGEGVGRFEVRTPVTITGVRGTRYRLHVAQNRAHSEVLHGNVDMSGRRDAGARGVPVAVASGQGAVLEAQGQIQVHTLPPAPIVQSPRRIGSGQWTAQVTPVPGAAAYLVRVSRDPRGLEVLSSKQFDSADVYFAARRPGLHYASIRAINAAGIGGYETFLSFEGATSLMSSSGQPVLLADGTVVTLHNY